MNNIMRSAVISFLFLVTLFLTLVVTFLVFVPTIATAQEDDRAAITRIGSYTVISQQSTNGEPSDRIVEIISGDNLGLDPSCRDASPPVPPQSRTISFSVPPEDVGHYKYIISSFRQNGGGGSIATADAFGNVKTEVIEQQVYETTPCGHQPKANPGILELEEEYFYLVATHIDTSTRYYTVDLRQVPFIPLLNSLQRSFPNPGRYDDARIRKETTIRMEVRQHNQALDPGLFISVRGNKLTLDELLDEIYNQSGCYVVESENWLLIESC